MSQAIITKFLGPTNTKGSRVKATCDAKTRVYTWNHALKPEANHKSAALKLLTELRWLRPDVSVHSGALPGGAGYCFVLVEKED